MSFGWAYPPGVTGNEYEIAGPDFERETSDIACGSCGNREDNMEFGYHARHWITCAVCEEITDLDAPVDDWDDPADDDEPYE